MAIPLTPLLRTKSRAQQLIERRIGETIEQALHRLYAVEGHQQDEIAAEWGIDRATVSRWMTQYGIEARITGPRTLIRKPADPFRADVLRGERSKLDGDVS